MKYNIYYIYIYIQYQTIKLSILYTNKYYKITTGLQRRFSTSHNINI